MAVEGSSNLVTAGRAWGSRDVPFFINEIKIVVVAFNGFGDQYLGLAFARLVLLAHVALAVDEVKVLLIVPFQA